VSRLLTKAGLDGDAQVRFAHTLTEDAEYSLRISIEDFENFRRASSESCKLAANRSISQRLANSDAAKTKLPAVMSERLSGHDS
ncbi:MAG: hypothetical protein AAGF98_09195, partial [Cyanobacteria bacterium P01_H01_bin.153]